jgi:hypothetical protein
MKVRILIGIAFCLGIALGFFLAKITAVHASPLETVRVTKVRRIPIVGEGTTMVAGQVVGISCVPTSDGGADCYVAFQ